MGNAPARPGSESSGDDGGGAADPAAGVGTAPGHPDSRGPLSPQELGLKYVRRWPRGRYRCVGGEDHLGATGLQSAVNDGRASLTHSSRQGQLQRPSGAVAELAAHSSSSSGSQRGYVRAWDRPAALSCELRADRRGGELGSSQAATHARRAAKLRDTAKATAVIVSDRVVVVLHDS
jgi:hypothetical protein